MHTVQVQLEDDIYNDMVSRGVNLQDELKNMLKKAIYKKEHQIANGIKQGLEDVKKGKTRPVQDLLNEL